MYILLGRHSLYEGVRIPSHVCMAGASTAKAIDCYVPLYIRVSQCHHFVIRVIPLAVSAVEVSGNDNRRKYIGTAATIVIAPSRINTHCHDLRPPLPFNCTNQQRSNSK